MLYPLGILIIASIGFLSIQILTGRRLNLILHILLALLLGLGIAGSTAFYIHILLGAFDHWLPVGALLTGIIYLSLQGAKRRSNLKKNKLTIKDCIALRARNDNHWGLLALTILAIPLTISALHFPLGGWDAWSCWGLKAKFIFLGKENWKDVLAPGLWRSNTQYPLLWPLINVWFWDLSGNFDQTVPMLNSIVIALLTAGILTFGILELTGNLWAALCAGVIVTALPFNAILFISQYSDALLGLFLMSAFLCLFLAKKLDLPRLKILSMIFLGLMAFTKNEGLIAACIAGFGVFWIERSNKKNLKPLIITFFIAMLPTIIFTLFMAPKNEAFINGLASTDKPTGLSRLIVIFLYPWVELISGKWNGYWFLVLGGIFLAGKQLWRSTLGLIAITLILYFSVVMAYYAVNTFFEIGWWLQTTLSRILFALIPTITLWIALGLTTKDG